MKTSIDFYQHFSINVKCLKLMGLWYYIPYPVNSIWFWVAVLSRVVIGFFVFILSTGGQIVYLVRLILSGNFSILDVAGILNLIITELMTEIKLLDLRLRRDSFSKFIDQLNNEHFKSHRRKDLEICQKAIKFSRMMTITLLFSTSMDVFVHAVVVPAVGKFETLPLKMDLILFDVNDPKYFNYVCAYQILYKPIMVITFATLQSLPWAAMSFTTSQLDVLIHNLENMKELVKSAKLEANCDETKAFCEAFRRLVLHHSAIIRFINILQDTFSGQLSAYLFMSAAVIGTTAVQFFSIESPGENFTDVIWILAYLTIFIAILFVDCYFGNLITNKCELVSTCVFSCPWINVDNNLKKNVIIFMAKTQQPVVLSAIKQVPVSLETFTKVMNWTYKGFAVMNQMK